MNHLVLAVDIGATKAALSVRTLRELEPGWGTTREVVRIATPGEPRQLVAWVEGHAERLQRALGGRLAAAGVAAPGPLDARTGIITRSSNLGWIDVPLGPMLSERLGIPVRLEDDANAAALGEWRFGAGRGAEPMGYVTVSSGVGGAVVVAGEVVHGAAGNAGEVGHIVIDAAGPRCACGRRGDVESYAGGSAIARRARRTWPQALLADGTRAPRTAAEVFAAARAGDPDAQVLAADASRALATAFSALAAVVEPQVVVVGGSVGLRQRAMVRRATTLARRMVMSENGRSLRVVTAELGPDSVLAGAADLALRLIGERR